MVVIFERWCELGRSTFRSIYAQFALCFSVVFVIFLGNLSADPDLFARVAMGRLIESLGHVPLFDPFAFTPKKILWIDHEWLSGVVFYFLSQNGGDAALFFGKVFVVGLTIWFLLQATKLFIDDTQPALPWILFCTVSSSFVWISTVRCQVFTYLFIAFTLYAFALYMQRNKTISLLTLPLVMLLWCNLHGGFFVGLGLQGLLCFYLLIDAIRQNKKLPWIPGLVGVASLFSTAVNPYGAQLYWEYIIHALTMPRPNIDEWAAVPVFSASGIVLLILSAISLIGIYKMPNKDRWLPALMLAFGFWMGFRHERLVALTMFLCVVFGSIPYLEFAKLVSSKIPRFTFLLSRTAQGMALATTIVCLGIFVFRSATYSTFQLSTASYPAAAFDALRSSTLKGNLLVDFNTGSFALWRLYPNFKISMDGRYEEVYPESTNQLVARALAFDTPTGKQSFVEVNPDVVLLNGRSTLASTWSKHLPEWYEIYRDPSYILISRNPGKLNPVTETRPIWMPW